MIEKLEEKLKRFFGRHNIDKNFIKIFAELIERFGMILILILQSAWLFS